MRVVKPNTLTLTDSNVPAYIGNNWSDTTAYAVNATVHYHTDPLTIGRLYKCLVAHTGHAPTVGADNTWWQHLRPATWSSATTYAINDRVYYTASTDMAGRQYKALTAGSAMTPVPGGTTDWLDLGPINQRAMFDSLISSATIFSSGDPATIQVSVTTTEAFDTIALLRMGNVYTANITVMTGAVEVLNVDFTAAGSTVYFDDPRRLLNIIHQHAAEITPTSTVITVTLNHLTSAAITCPLLMVGQAFNLGDTESQPTVGIEDYSTKEVDEFGNVFLLPRAFADRASVSLLLDTAKVDAIRRKLAAYRALPVLWDLNNSDTSFESLMIFGYFENFEITLTLPGGSYCKMDVQQLL